MRIGNLKRLSAYPLTLLAVGDGCRIASFVYNVYAVKREANEKRSKNGGQAVHEIHARL
jgi:hypothetical protein